MMGNPNGILDCDFDSILLYLCDVFICLVIFYCELSNDFFNEVVDYCKFILRIFSTKI